MISSHMVPTVVMVAMVRDYPLKVRIFKQPFTLNEPVDLCLTDRILPLCAACLMVMQVGVANAGHWSVDPSLRISETYTDNVALAPQGQEESDFITLISPGVSIQGQRGRSYASLDYALNNLIYASDKSRNEVNHQLAADGRAELISDWMFLDARANVAQQNISLLGPIGIDVTNENENTTETRTYALSPFFRGRLGSTLLYEARYQRDYVSADGTDLTDSNADTAIVSINSGTDLSKLRWSLNYINERVDYRQSEDTRIEKVTLDGSYGFTPRFGVLGTVGYEENDYVYVGEKPKGDFWSAGIFWRPSSLTSLRMSAGERFFGKTEALDFSHRSRRFLWSARYSEDISSTRSSLLIPTAVNTFSYLDSLVSAGISDPIQRARVVNAFIAERGLPSTIFTATNFFTNRTFLQKRFDGSVAFNTPKTTYILSLFMDDRDAEEIGATSNILGADDFSTSSNVRQQGVNFLINWQFAPKTNVDFNVGGNDTNFRDTGRDDQLKFIRIGLRHRLQPKVSGSIDFRHLERDSNVELSDYVENAVSAALNIQF